MAPPGPGTDLFIVSDENQTINSRFFCFSFYICERYDANYCWNPVSLKAFVNNNQGICVIIKINPPLRFFVQLQGENNGVIRSVPGLPTFTLIYYLVVVEGWETLPLVLHGKNHTRSAATLPFHLLALEAVLGRPGPILAYWRWDHHGSPLCMLLLYFSPISEQLLKRLAVIYSIYNQHYGLQLHRVFYGSCEQLWAFFLAMPNVFKAFKAIKQAYKITSPEFVTGFKHMLMPAASYIRWKI